MYVYAAENLQRRWFIGARHTKMKIILPDSVKRIIGVLEENGYEAYAVGGCVRDSLLGKQPKDWDITTSAKPDQVKALFHRTIDTGIEHGTVTVMMHHEGYEVTTYRIDGKYEDGRHPKEVIFTPSLEEDLKRRDFTINAMAYSDRTGIVDKFHGVEDLQSHIIRCVGVAKERFTEDALRILRAVRFSAALDFSIEEETLQALTELAPNLRKISRERIQAELEKLLMSDHPERAELLFFTGIIPEIFDGCPQVTAQESLADMLAQLCRSPKQHYVRWSLFLGGLAYEGVLKSLKFDNKTIRICEKYHAYRQEKLCADKSAIRHLAVNIGSDIFFDYLDFRQAVGNEDPQVLEQVRRLYQEIVDDGDALSLKELAVNGKLLAECGVAPGAEMGRILNELFDLVLTDAGLNEKEILLKIISSKKTS